MAEQNGGNTENNCKTPLGQLWNSQIKSMLPFPSKKELIQHPKYKTLGDLMQKLIGNKITDEED
jgi:hypothetical protein